MSYLLKMLSDMLQKPSTTFSYPHMSQTKSQTRRTEIFYLAPPSSLDIATARNPRQFGHTNTDLGLTEMALQTLCCLLQLLRSHRNVQSVPSSLLDILSVALLLQFALTELMQSVPPS